MADTKICASCQAAKPRDEFPTVAGGRGRLCYGCEGIETPRPGEKHCGDCGKNKPLTEFYRLRAGGEARQARCKRCAADRAAGRAPNGSRSPTRGRACTTCEDLSWRRDPVFGCVCGGQYAEEEPARAVDYADDRKDAGGDG